MTTALTNENCLEGICCPSCASEGPFDITVTAVSEVHDDGTEDTNDQEWNDESPIVCKQCHHADIVSTFSASASAINLHNPIAIGERLFFTDPTVKIYDKLGSTGWYTVVSAPVELRDMDDECYRDVIISLVNEAGSEVEACYAELSREPATSTMTAFCQQANAHGTIWIQAIAVPMLSSVDAQLDLARLMAIQECAQAWYGDDDDGGSFDIVCLGLIEGNANVLAWDDSHLLNG
jgi:hypothetical protein